LGVLVGRGVAVGGRGVGVLVMTGGGAFVEVQGTAEERPFTQAQLDAMLELAARGIRQMVTVQREALGAAIAFARRPEGKG